LAEKSFQPEEIASAAATLKMEAAAVA